MPRLVEAQAAAGGRAPRVSALHTTDDRLGAQFDIGILRTSWRPEGGNFARSEPSVTLLAPPRRAEALQLAGLAGVEAETILVAETRNGEFEGWIEAAGISRPAAIRRLISTSLHRPQWPDRAASSALRTYWRTSSTRAGWSRRSRITSEGAMLTAVFDPGRCTAALVDRLVEAVFRQF
jgi:LysR family transcriptional regulator, glycine cleavage system transcriptional activator